MTPAFGDEQLLAEGYLNCGLTHSATLTALIENTMKTARKSFDEIDSIALTVGPGSYTGLRIALSAAKGMAMVKKLPCIPVSTLLSLAYNLTMYNGVVCAALDARVGQVFAALFEVKNGKVTRLTDDAAITLAELGELSIEHNSAPVEVPDFTRGGWQKIDGYSHAMAE